jgi:ABC-2 type transport system ATP-binding protein
MGAMISSDPGGGPPVGRDAVRPAVLETEGLTKRFGDIQAVAGLALRVYEGEVFGLLGPNGAGKSTTINMICGLLRPDSGSIRLFGEEVRPGAAVVKRRVGVCPQDLVVWAKLTCLEQLEFMGEMYGLPRSLARRRGSDLLAELGLSDKRNRTAATLSGGMKRRLNLALALIHDPDVVVLDEPEAGLDPQSRVMVREYIRAMAKRKTVLFTTHNMDEAERICDRVAIVDRGAVLNLDTPEHLKRTIGPGGLVEILVGDAPAGPEDVSAALARLGLQARFVGDSLVVRGPDIVASLAGILDCLKGFNVDVRDVRLRENTLEDVFIALTGRRLRE